MQLCPLCASPEARVVLTKDRKAGWRYRRLQCSVCRHRWSMRDTSARPRSHYDQRRLTDREAACIVLSADSQRALASRYGISHQSVNQIRRGLAYRNVHLLLQPLLNHAEGNAHPSHPLGAQPAQLRPAAQEAPP